MVEVFLIFILGYLIATFVTIRKPLEIDQVTVANMFPIIKPHLIHYLLLTSTLLLVFWEFKFSLIIPLAILALLYPTVTVFLDILYKKIEKQKWEAALIYFTDIQSSDFIQ
jgi:hypothetical protein